MSRRRVALEREGGSRGSLVQVKYYDPRVEVWCDYGDPVPADEADAKAERCRAGLTP